MWDGRAHTKIMTGERGFLPFVLVDAPYSPDSHSVQISGVDDGCCAPVHRSMKLTSSLEYEARFGESAFHRLAEEQVGLGLLDVDESVAALHIAPSSATQRDREF